METIEIIECVDFGREILRALGSTLALVARNNIEYSLVDTKNDIKASLRIEKIEGPGKGHETTMKCNGMSTIHFCSG